MLSLSLCTGGYPAIPSVKCRLEEEPPDLLQLPFCDRHCRRRAGHRRGLVRPPSLPLSSPLVSERFADATDIERCGRHTGKYTIRQAWRYISLPAVCNLGDLENHEDTESTQATGKDARQNRTRTTHVSSLSISIFISLPLSPPPPLSSLSLPHLGTHVWWRSGRGEVRERDGPRAHGHTDLHLRSHIALHHSTDTSGGVARSCMTRSRVKANFRFLTRCDAVTFRDRSSLNCIIHNLS